MRSGIMVGLTIALFLSCGDSGKIEGTWKPLFNGKDLTGWENVGTGTWLVEDGAIVVNRTEGDEGRGWLVTEKDYGDFKLRFQFQPVSGRIHCGVLLRDPGHAKVSRPAFNGYEMQIHDNPEDKNRTGAIYELARAMPMEMKSGEWNDFEIHCIGDYIVSYVNGIKMAETHSRRTYKGAIGLQYQEGQDPGHFRWRNIEILELPEVPRDYRYMEEILEQAPGEFVDLLKGGEIEDTFDTYWEGGATWILEEDVLRCDGGDGIAWIFTKDDYTDFILTFDYRISDNGNGGTGIRFPWPTGAVTDTLRPAFSGFECQVKDTREVADRFPNGAIIYLTSAYLTDVWRRPIYRQGRWNSYRIYASGDHMITYVNRRKMAELHNDRSLSGRIGFNLHDPSEWVGYGNMKIKVIQ